MADFWSTSRRGTGEPGLSGIRFVSSFPTVSAAASGVVYITPDGSARIKGTEETEAHPRDAFILTRDFTHEDDAHYIGDSPNHIGRLGRSLHDTYYHSGFESFYFFTTVAGQLNGVEFQVSNQHVFAEVFPGINVLYRGQYQLARGVNAWDNTDALLADLVAGNAHYDPDALNIFFNRATVNVEVVTEWSDAVYVVDGADGAAYEQLDVLIGDGEYATDALAQAQAVFESPEFYYNTTLERFRHWFGVGIWQSSDNAQFLFLAGTTWLAPISSTVADQPDLSPGTGRYADHDAAVLFLAENIHLDHIRQSPNLTPITAWVYYDEELSDLRVLTNFIQSTVSEAGTSVRPAMVPVGAGATRFLENYGFTPDENSVGRVWNEDGNLVKGTRIVHTATGYGADWTAFVLGADIQQYFSGHAELNFRGVHLRGNEITNPRNNDCMVTPIGSWWRYYTGHGLQGFFHMDDPDHWLAGSPFDDEAEADAHVTGDGQVTMYGSKVYVSSNYVAPPEHQVTYGKKAVQPQNPRIRGPLWATSPNLRGADAGITDGNFLRFLANTAWTLEPDAPAGMARAAAQATRNETSNNLTLPINVAANVNGIIVASEVAGVEIDWGFMPWGPGASYQSSSSRAGGIAIVKFSNTAELIVLMRGQESVQGSRIVLVEPSVDEDANVPENSAIKIYAAGVFF